MKRLIFVLLIILIPFCACSRNFEFEVGQSMNTIENQHTPYIHMNALSAYKIEQKFLILISDENGIIQKKVEFSSERKCCQTQGLTLIKNEMLDQFLNVDYKKAKETLGDPHVDIGSGFYIPAYITEDAYLISFELENKTIVGIIKRDLLTNNKA